MEVTLRLAPLAHQDLRAIYVWLLLLLLLIHRLVGIRNEFKDRLVAMWSLSTLSAAALCILSLRVVRIVVLFKGCVQIDLYHLITFTMIVYAIVLSSRLSANIIVFWCTLWCNLFCDFFNVALFSDVFQARRISLCRWRWCMAGHRPVVSVRPAALAPIAISVLP